MKKKLKIFIASVGLMCICSIGVAMAQPDGSTSAPAENKVQTAHDLTKLEKQGIKLTKPTVQAAISESQAIEIASKFAEGYAKEAKQIVAEYHLITNEKFSLFTETAKEKNQKLKKEGFLNQTAVYIVTFKGITKYGHQPFSKKDQAPPVLHEYNIVIDANSGEPLYGFSYK